MIGTHLDLFGIVKRIVGRQGTIPVGRGTGDRHRHQYREVDAKAFCRTRN